MRSLIGAILLSLLSAAAHAQSEGLKTDWLELVLGHKCEQTGAEIMAINRHPETGDQSVMVKLPKNGLADTMVMEEVRVVGKAPEKTELPELFPEMETEWVEDYDNDHYGLLVKLTGDQKLPIRLYFGTGDTTLDGAP